MTEEAAFSRNIFKYMDREGITGLSLSKRAGVPQKTVWTIQNGTVRPNLSNVIRICKGLDVDPSIAIIEDVSHENMRHSRRYGRMLRDFLGLTESQKEIIMGMVQTFKIKESEGG